MKKRYILISLLMILPLFLSFIAHLFARNAIAQDLDIFLLCGAATFCLGGICMLQARKALKKGTYIGRFPHRYKLSGKKGEKQLLQAGIIVTSLFSAIFSILIIASTI